MSTLDSREKESTCLKLLNDSAKKVSNTPTNLRLVADIISSVQSLNRVPFFATPWTEACQASLSITNSQCLLKLMSIESVMPQGQGLWVRQTWVCLVLQTWVLHKSSWWRSPLTPPKSCQNVHRTGEIDSWRT